MEHINAAIAAADAAREATLLHFRRTDLAADTKEVERFDPVMGLEVHVELATETKMFSASPNRFGDEPNTNIDPVTLGLPGALPVLNEQAVELAMRIGLALNCTIQPCTFHRKNYFYPDMPKAYQISQYDQPDRKSVV